VLRIDARDRVGNAATSNVPFTSDNSRPSLRLLGAATVLAGAPFRGTSVAADGGSGLAGAPAWALGDGSSASGAQVVHRYRRPGRYTVGASVSDLAGNSTSASRSLRVVALLIKPATGRKPAIWVRLARPGTVRVKLGRTVVRTLHVGRGPRRIPLSGLKRGGHRVTVTAGGAQATRVVRVP
jgi:hypothetical protein